MFTSIYFNEISVEKVYIYIELTKNNSRNNEFDLTNFIILKTKPFLLRILKSEINKLHS